MLIRLALTPFCFENRQILRIKRLTMLESGYFWFATYLSRGSPHWRRMRRAAMWGFPLQRNKMGVLCVRLFAVISSIPEVTLCCRPSVKIQYVVSFKEFHLVAREAVRGRERERERGGGWSGGGGHMLFHNHYTHKPTLLYNFFPLCYYCNRTFGPFLILGSGGVWRLPKRHSHWNKQLSLVFFM